MSEGARLGYLDGLRGVAILAVMAEHTKVPIARAGYLGVTVFFVLSGYLITSILLREFDRSGTVSLRRFYARRALRLYPALLVLVAVILVAPRLFGLNGFGESAPAALVTATYLGDIAIWLSWPVHMVEVNWVWTLGVEELFYLIWPGVLLLLLRAGRDRLVPVVLALGIANSVVALWTGTSAGGGLHEGVPAGVYFRPDARAGEILIGCLCAFALVRRPPPDARRMPPVAGWLAAAVLVALLAVGPGADEPIAYRVGIPLSAVATAVLIAVLADGATRGYRHGAGLLARALGWRPLCWLGVVSYGAYLVNPIAVRISTVYLHLSRGAAVVPGVVLTLALAALSYRFVEQPFLRLKTRFGSPGTLTASRPADVRSSRT